MARDGHPCPAHTPALDLHPAALADSEDPAVFVVLHPHVTTFFPSFPIQWRGARPGIDPASPSRRNGSFSMFPTSKRLFVGQCVGAVRAPGGQ